MATQAQQGGALASHGRRPFVDHPALRCAVAPTAASGGRPSRLPPPSLPAGTGGVPAPTREPVPGEPLLRYEWRTAAGDVLVVEAAWPARPRRTRRRPSTVRTATVRTNHTSICARRTAPRRPPSCGSSPRGVAPRIPCADAPAVGSLHGPLLAVGCRSSGGRPADIPLAQPEQVEVILQPGPPRTATRSGTPPTTGTWPSSGSRWPRAHRRSGSWSARTDAGAGRSRPSPPNPAPSGPSRRHVSPASTRLGHGERAADRRRRPDHRRQSDPGPLTEPPPPAFH